MTADEAVNPSRPPAEGGRDDVDNDDERANEAVNPDRPPAEGGTEVGTPPTDGPGATPPGLGAARQGGEVEAPEPNEPA